MEKLFILELFPLLIMLRESGVGEGEERGEGWGVISAIPRYMLDTVFIRISAHLE